jgi:hypothetical protein
MMINWVFDHRNIRRLFDISVTKSYRMAGLVGLHNTKNAITIKL